MSDPTPDEGLTSEALVESIMPWLIGQTDSKAKLERWLAAIEAAAATRAIEDAVEHVAKGLFLASGGGDWDRAIDGYWYRYTARRLLGLDPSDAARSGEAGE